MVFFLKCDCNKKKVIVNFLSPSKKTSSLLFNSSTLWPRSSAQLSRWRASLKGYLGIHLALVNPWVVWSWFSGLYDTHLPTVIECGLREWLDTGVEVANLHQHNDPYGSVNEALPRTSLTLLRSEPGANFASGCSQDHRRYKDLCLELDIYVSFHLTCSLHW